MMSLQKNEYRYLKPALMDLVGNWGYGVKIQKDVLHIYEFVDDNGIKLFYVLQIVL